MPEYSGPIYEVTHVVDRDVADRFDDWLRQHIDEMLEMPGIVDAASFDDDGDGPRVTRVTQYRFANEAELDQYLAGPAAVMRRSAETLFAGHFDVSRRVLRPSLADAGDDRSREICLNCGQSLFGQYCGQCGQRARSRLISIWELTQEAFGDLLEIDSRLWRTLIPLAVRPGRLTRDYLEGRRARFMPPFRTYLVLSIVFFLVAFFDPREELGILFEPADDTVPESTAESQDADAVRREVLQELADEGLITPAQVNIGAPDANGRESAPADDESAGQPEEEADDDGTFNIRINGEDPSEGCNVDEFDTSDLPLWLRSRLTPERLKVVCDRVVAEPKVFLGKLLDNVPAALFILLPLMALVLKILYPLSKRYYVEHLLFVVHYHAFVFLTLTVQILFTRAASLAGLPEAASVLTTLAVSVYILVYLFKAMRRVYGQGRLMTLLKYLFLQFTYLVGLALILIFAALFAAFSI